MQHKIIRATEIGVAGLIFLSSCSLLGEVEKPSLELKYRDISMKVETTGSAKIELGIPQCIVPSPSEKDILIAEMFQPDEESDGVLPEVLNLGSAIVNVLGASSGL